MEQISTSAQDPFVDDEVLDSEDEQDRKDELESAFTVAFKVDAIPGPVSSVLVVPAGNGQSLTRIVLETGSEATPEIGKVEITQADKPPKDVLKVYYNAAKKLLVLHPEGIKGGQSTTVIEQLFALLPDPQPRILIIDSVYKTNYTSPDGFMSIEEGNYPLFTYKTTHVDAQLRAFIAKHKPAGVLNLMGGFSAALLIHAEINGMSAAAIHAIVDSHFVTAETLSAFSGLFKEVLDLPFEAVHRLPKFKEVLKEANQRGHNIFN
jgi:hypothetical protein